MFYPRTRRRKKRRAAHPLQKTKPQREGHPGDKARPPALVDSLSQIMPNFLPYDPGSFPRRPAPAAGESLVLEVPGEPPVKTRRQSIRNKRHPQHRSFVALRQAAIRAMAGRAWYFGPVKLCLTVFGRSSLDGWRLIDYLGGIMDTLDGSSGRTFTYLPIVFEDDCQVCETRTKWVRSSKESYRLRVTFK
jgi:hypothetical protein